MYYGSYWLLGLLSTYAVVIVAIAVLEIIAGWKIFTKANQAGWASIIPFYSDYIKFKIFWGNGWLFLLPIACSLLSAIPVFGYAFSILAIVIHVLMSHKKALAFGEGWGFAIGLFFLPTIFEMILGFSSKYQYKGVPIDGTSYKELKTALEAKEAKTTYEKPEEVKADVKFEEPEVKKEASEVKKETVKKASTKKTTKTSTKKTTKKEDK